VALNGKPFDVEVDGVGTFVFRQRTIRDQFRIEAEASRVMGGPCDDAAVEAPTGWDLEGFDPLDPAATARIFDVARRLRETEATFRAGAGGKGA
jgi:hypothetical protein